MDNNSSLVTVGVTGGIGAGKSLICKIFSSLGVPIYNADNRAKALMVSNAKLVASIKLTFGEEAYTSEGELNRSYLAEQVFNDESKRVAINELVHPIVGDDFAEWCVAQAKAGVQIAIKEAALMVESGTYNSLDHLVVVTASQETRIQRTLLRDDFRSRADIKKIIDAQVSEGQQTKLADFVIDNNEGKALIPQVLKVYEVLKSSAAS